MSTARYRLLNLVLVAALFAGSAWAYPRLPERIPTHFDLAGRPDAWEDRSPASWFMLPVLALALAGGLLLVSRYALRHPETWNLPDKRRFLALDQAAQEPIVQRMERFVAFVSVVVTGLLCAIQTAVFRTATGHAPEAPMWILVAVGTAVVVMFTAAVRLNTAVARMIRDASAPVGD
jgi:uncharacterized membrane protein